MKLKESSPPHKSTIFFPPYLLKTKERIRFSSNLGNFVQSPKKMQFDQIGVFFSMLFYVHLTFSYFPNKGYDFGTDKTWQIFPSFPKPPRMQLDMDSENRDKWMLET